MKGDGFMTYKQIETSREIRLWLGQLLIPAIMAGATLLSIPEINSTVNEKIRRFKKSKENLNKH